MELLQIKYFKVLAQTENITKAAQILFVAQPSLSQMLKRLEEELGTPLFDRVGKRIILNTAGQIFLKYCDQILTAVDNAQLELEEYKGKQITDINIAVDSASLLIPEIVQRIRNSYPKIMPHIFQDYCPDWDIKIYSDSILNQSSLLLMEERIGIALHKSNPLNQKESIFSADLKQCNFISMTPAHNLHNIVNILCEKFDFSPNISMSVDSPAMLRDLVKMNLGIAFVPEKTWRNFYSDGLVFRPIADMPINRYVQLSQNTKKHPTKAARCCKIVITEYFEEYNRKFR